MNNNCPICGGTVAYMGLFRVECRTLGCDNYVKPKPNTWNELLWDDLRKFVLKSGIPKEEMYFIVSKTKKRTP